MNQNYPTVYTKPYEFAWTKAGTSIQGGIYRVTNLDMLLGAVSLNLRDDEKRTSTKPDQGVLNEGDYVVCTKNMIDNTDMICLGQCEYVVVDVIEGQGFVPRENGVIRTYVPLERAHLEGNQNTDKPCAVTKVCDMKPEQFVDFCRDTYKNRPEAPNGPMGSLVL